MICRDVESRSRGTYHAKQDRLSCPCHDDATAALDGSLRLLKKRLSSSQDNELRSGKGGREGGRVREEKLVDALTMNAEEIPKQTKIHPKPRIELSTCSKSSLNELTYLTLCAGKGKSELDTAASACSVGP